MRTALITVAHGRHHHLRLQEVLLERLDPPADARYVVAMADPELRDVVANATRVLELDADPAELPLAAARNRGAEQALADGAELLVFLDVDCLPDPHLVRYYARAAARDLEEMRGDDPGALYAGPVAYLPRPPEEGYDLERLNRYPFHPRRPQPDPGEIVPGGRHELFWSLSFAVTAADWSRIGGFEPEYVGYGAEDTDFAMLARQAGVGLTWVGGAAAYHQWHPTSDPPHHHLDEILRNGAIYARRWGQWPMVGWLRAFEAAGLVSWSEETGWVRAEGRRAGASGGWNGQK